VGPASPRGSPKITTIRRNRTETVEISDLEYGLECAKVEYDDDDKDAIDAAEALGLSVVRAAAPRRGHTRSVSQLPIEDS
jgi:hypothetical protein